ncbi:O-antigen ligase [Variovorax sp. dw_308]|uniref:O-antigen ligase family protein n=1 Tax=Variovorax sp. dw_308 TaxID=2721546 RepID=UPI001C476F14|nr:O-antigen ligase family protein [Variovorax sp. dw_308]
MLRTRLVRYTAAFWGFVVYMPVGVNYGATVFLFLAMLLGGSLRERGARLRASPMWWPIVIYLAWTLVVLAVGQHYPETAENLFHGIRIASTMLLAMALTRVEAVWALRGFLLVSMINLVLIVLNEAHVLPDQQIWRAVVSLQGNKSINDALLFTVLGASTAVLGLVHLADARRWHWAGPAFVFTVLMALIVTLVLPSRTSLVAMLVCVVAACVHQWRSHPRLLAGALAAVFVVAGLLVWQAPAAMKEKFELGLHEVEQAQAGEVSEASMITRYIMYRETTAMMLEKPVIGLGIGAWTSEWKKRGPKVLDYKNMPHNDYLWMGSQGGIPGFLSLLFIMVAGVWVCWRRPDLTGRLGFVAMLTLLIAASLNSALRDAQIGLCLPWICFLYLRLAEESGSPWREVLPQRLSGVFVSADGSPTHSL